MEKQTKITYILLGLSVFSVLFHNLIYTEFGVQEPVFFFVACVAALAFLVSVGGDLFLYSRKGRPKDIWKLGYIGLIGVLGGVTGVLAFTAFFAFFAFFGFKK